MAVEGVAGKLISAGLALVIARLAGDEAIPARSIADCVVALLPGRAHGEARRIAHALSAEAELILGGQTSLDKAGAEAALHDANELVQRFGLSSDQLAALAPNVAPDEGAGPWRRLAAEAARRVVETGQQRFAGDDAHRAFCLRIVTAYYRGVLQNDECRQRLLSSLVVAGQTQDRQDHAEIKSKLDLLVQGVENRGLAACRDLNIAGPVNIGIPPAELPAIIEAATKPLKELNDEQRAQLRMLEERLGVGQQALLAFFQTIGEAEVPPEQQAAKLAEIAARFNELREQVVVTADDDAEVARLKSEAQAALDAGRLDDADALLAQIFDAQGRAIERRALEQAETAAQRGDLALMRLRYRDAARQFALAARTVPCGEDERRLDYLWREAEALYRSGDAAGDNEALADSISRWRDLLAEYPRERVPLDWAAIQNNLGNAHFQMAVLSWSTGECEQAIAQFRNAANAYSAALEEFDRVREPPRWGAAKNNLGNALGRLSEHTGDAALLRQAVAAYCEALKVRRRARVPFDWAETRCHLGNALHTMYELEHCARRLRQARAAYIAALQVYTRDHQPLRWADTRNNLSLTLLRLGQRVGDPKLLREALDCLKDAREVLVDEAGQTHRKAEFNQKIAAVAAALRDLSAGGRALP